MKGGDGPREMDANLTDCAKVPRWREKSGYALVQLSSVKYSTVGRLWTDDLISN